ncbi:MAG: hypothetical protein AB1505_17815 [Candidatus Latescibacterota bacterium]
MTWGAAPAAAEVAARTAPADTQGAEVFLSVKGRSRLLAVALVPFGLDSSAAGHTAEAAQLFGILRNDLANAVRFEVAVDSLGADSSGWGAVLERWTRAGASALLRGSVLGYPDRLEVFATLYRLPDRRMLIAKAYPAPPGQSAAAMHRLSDDVVFALTGQMGIASSRLAYIGEWDGHPEVHLMTWDGQEARAVTVDRALALSPAWAPDGRRLAYSSLQGQRWELYVVDLISGARRAVPTPSAMSTAPCWSPDGERLLFAMVDGGNIDLYTVEVSSGRLQRVTDHPETDTEPDWSPDGTRIAFVSDRTGLPQVYIADARGGEARRLTWEPDAYEGSPAWSPDSKRIAFVRRGFDGFDIYVSEVEGGLPVRLTAGGSNENPSWSPDGLQLVFGRTVGTQDDIYVMNYDGTNLRQLTADGKSTMPTWSPRLDMDSLVQYGSR